METKTAPEVKKEENERKPPVEAPPATPPVDIDALLLAVLGPQARRC